MYKKSSIIALAMVFTTFLICNTLPAHAKVSAQEAERLKKDLTPFGAERAGNSEGTIPAWDGGINDIPEGITFDPEGNMLPPDPYADDTILYTITAKNMEKYADRLSAGLKELFRKYPDTWKMNVYPTRRPFAAPQKIYDLTYQNALTAELINGGDDGIKGAFGGIPFPIPKNGAESIYNHILKYSGSGYVFDSTGRIVYSDGTRVTGGTGRYYFLLPYYAAQSSEKFFDGPLAGITSAAMVEYVEPARRKGEIVLAHEFLDYSQVDLAAWQYMPGQRRVRRAPNLLYDAPNPGQGGYATMDDGWMFNGQIDRFNWDIKGKKEMYVPYNCYAIEKASINDVTTPFHSNPDLIRWENHRVWEIEANLKESTRHCYSKRTLYQDEDSWLVLVHDKWDTRGELWRTAFCCSIQFYNTPCLRQRSAFYYDFQVNAYVASNLGQEVEMNLRDIEPPIEMFTPQNIRKIGKR